MKNNKKVQKKAVTTKSKATAVKKVIKPSKPLKNNVKQVSKTAVKKPAAKTIKAPVKAAVKKPAAKVTKAPAKAVKAPVKVVAKVTPQKAAPVKVMAKAVAKPIAQKTAPAKAPIMVKAPINQNKGIMPAAKATKSPVVMQRTAEGLKPVSSNSMQNRPAYRPIQVINKPLPSAQPARAMAPAPANEKVEYKKGDYVVYPAHGVGQIEAVESQIISGMDIKLYAIVFEKDRMRLKVPVFKAHASGLRRLSSPTQMQDALKTLQGRAHVRRVMWSRRAQEYETKINSGDPVAIAEVLRDLKRSNDDNEQSYSERQIYQSALERLAREVAALERITEIEASEKLEVLIKGKRAVKVEEKKEADIAVAEVKEAKAA
jgi:CarD family transcriptional regulator